MGPETRAVARLVNELESTARKLRNRLEAIESLELDSRAWRRMNDAKPNENGVLERSRVLPDDLLSD